MKKMIAFLLVLALCCTFLPQIAHKAEAVTWIKNRADVDGYDFTTSDGLAVKLNSIFDGNASVYKDSDCTELVDTKIGNYAVPNNGVTQYVGPYGGNAKNSGTSCWIYANGVYYTLFGECTGNGVAGSNSEKLNLSTTTNKKATYSNFQKWGVRNSVGALIRADGHSMIVMAYDENTLTILDGNGGGDGKGLVSLRIRKWSEISFTVSYIIQPKEAYYYSLYPLETAAERAYLEKCTVYPTHGTIQTTKSTYVKRLPCSEKTNVNSTNVEVASSGTKYEAIGLYRNTAGNLWYKVKAKNGSVGYIYSADTTFVSADFSDIVTSGITAPTNHTVGKSYTLTGTISSTYCLLDDIVVSVINTQGNNVTGTSDNVTDNKYLLKGSAADKGTKFGSLTVGTYIYRIVVYLKYYYVQPDTHTTAVLYRRSFGVYEKTFNVVNASCSHSYTSKVTTAAGCTTAGIRTYTCGKCANSYTESIAATGHSYKNATCTAPKTCETCGATSGSALDHSYNSGVITTKPGCTTTGVKTYTCTRCNATKTESVAATGHTYNNATCTAPQTCTTCGATSGSALGHSYNSGVITTKPGCTTTGVKTYTCTRCSATKTETVAATGHTEEIIPGKDATCIEGGLTVGKKCSTCGEVLVAQQALPSNPHKVVTIPGKEPTTTTPGLTEGQMCERCGMILVAQEEIPPVNPHAYDHDFDATCNICGEVREINGKYEFVNYRVVFADSDETHKNWRAVIYKLGDKSVADPSNENALKAIDGAAVTKWGINDINKILLTDAGNYVVLLKYNIGTALVRVPLVIRVTANPKMIIDKNNKITALDGNTENINHRVVVYYLGDQTVADIYDEAALLAIDSEPETVWKLKYINRLALTRGGNYVLHLCYNEGQSAKLTVAQQFTVESIPTLSVNNNNKIVVAEENAENKNHRAVVYYLGDALVEDPYDETAVKAAAVTTSKTYWGLSAINKVELTQGGNYVIHLYYNVGTSEKRTLALDVTLNERPKVSVDLSNKLVVEYTDPAINTPRAYIYKVGDAEITDIYDEAALKAIATPTQVWGLSSINKKTLTPGTYVIHFHYNVDTSAKKTVAIRVTV